MSDGGRLFRPKLPEHDIHSGDIIRCKEDGKYQDYLIYYGHQPYQYWVRQGTGNFQMVNAEAIAWWWTPITQEGAGWESRFVGAVLFHPGRLGVEQFNCTVAGSVDNIPDNYDSLLRGKVIFMWKKAPDEASQETAAAWEV